MKIAIGFAAALFLFTATLFGQSLTITTLAGPRESPGAIDESGTAARFFTPIGVAVDSSGNVYVTDSGNYTVRVITPDGKVSTLAGLALNSGGANATGSDARFLELWGVAVDASGNVYVSEDHADRIRKIAPGAAVSTFYSAAGLLDDPRGLAVDSSGNIYAATSNNVIQQITPGGVRSYFAGSGSTGSSDGNSATAQFDHPYGVAIDPSGNFYVADTGNHTIRKIAGGTVTTLAGFVDTPGSADGSESTARFDSPNGIATDSSGNVYVADSGNHTIRKITPAGVVSTLAGLADNTGFADGSGSAARFKDPRGVAVDGSGNVYVADTGNQTIRKITPGGVVSTFAGVQGTYGSTNGTGNGAQFHYPHAVAVGSGGTIYVADTFNHLIRHVTPAGVVTTFAGTAGVYGYQDGTGTAAGFYNPRGIAVNSSGTIYVADTYNNKIRKITSGGEVTTLAGDQLFGSADGAGTAARFKKPRGLAVDSSGNIYVADTENSIIRKVTSGGVVTTLAGHAGHFGSTDATGPSARFSSPRGVAVDGSNNVYVADTGNHTIRKITPAGVVTTLAGLANNHGSTDGSGNVARFYNPEDVAFDGSSLYVSDLTNNIIRKVTLSGEVTTVAGLPLSYGLSDGTGSGARFTFPVGLDCDSSGNLYIAGYENDNIRKGIPSISDVATIDAASGTVGVSRQLDATPATASSWQWTLIRRPGFSTAGFSSTSVRNPTFTPDVEGLYTFRVMATYAGGGSASMSMVSLTATGPVTLTAPAALQATATSTTSVGLTWDAVDGATNYEVYRSSANGPYALVQTVSTNSATDNGLTASTTYLYKVRAVAGGSSSPYSDVDAATTILFTHDPLTAGTASAAVHFSQLHTAINAMRTAAGLAAASYPNPIAAGSPIRATDVTEMRAALAAARSAIGLTALSFTDSSITGGVTLIKAVHITELRNGVK